MLTLVSFLIAIGIIALVHELGHFLTAKKYGIYVKEFAIGFGPKLFGVKKGETEYNLRVLPMAGFVDLAGMDPDEELDPLYKDRGFNSKSSPVRFLILVAGAVMNIILAVGIYWGVYWVEGAPKVVKPIVGEVLRNGAAYEAGLKPGDIVLKINILKGDKKVEKEVDKFIDIVMAVATNPSKKLEFIVKRDNKVIPVIVIPKPDPKKNNLGSIGVSPRFLPAIVGETVKDGPAYIAKLQKNDKVIKIEGREINSWSEMKYEIQQSGGKKLNIEVLRGKEIVKTEVTPLLLTEEQKIGFFSKLKNMISSSKDKKKKTDKPELKQYYIGIEVQPNRPKRIKLGFGKAFIYSLKRVKRVSVDMFTGLYLLFTNQIPGGFKNTMGPVGIASFTGQRARAGFVVFFEWVALLSTYIGLFNLIPFPALDGGRLFFIILGWIIRKDISPKTEEKVHTIGFLLLLVLIIYVTYNDIARLITG